MRASGAGARGGFSLVEALIATTLGSIVVILVSGVFLVQNEFYGVVAQRTGMHDNARNVTDLVASAARKVARGGVVRADSARFVFREPLASGVVCAISGGNMLLHLPPGLADLDLSSADGYGIYSYSTGRWTYTAYTSWGTALSTSGDPAGLCAAAGADTTGIADEYVSASNLSVAVGTPVMIYNEIEHRFAPSVLRPGNTALFIGPSDGTLAEYATGLAADAHFAYRRGTSTYQTSVTGTNLSQIDGIRVWARAQADATSGQGSDAEYGWSTDVPFWNSR